MKLLWTAVFIAIWVGFFLALHVALFFEKEFNVLTIPVFLALGALLLAANIQMLKEY